MKKIDHLADTMLNRLVPHTTAAAGLRCRVQHVCNGSRVPNKCGNHRDRFRRVSCYRNDRWEIISETFVGCCP